MTTVFKITDLILKTDYRPVTTVLNFSKVFEKLIYLQSNNYMQN